jgi:hypothetical protein
VTDRHLPRGGAEQRLHEPGEIRRVRGDDARDRAAAAAPARAAAGRRPHVREGAARVRLVAPPDPARAFAAFSLLCLAVLALAWSVRSEAYLTPKRGVGYGLGILGLSLMTLQLLYTLRKRVAWLRRFGGLKPWFQVHMGIGLLGPVAILLHCNFRIGAVNSRVALLSMLVVAASGLAGRFLYTQIHAGLYGRRLRLRWLQQDLRLRRGGLAEALELAPELELHLRRFEDRTLAPTGGFAASLTRFLTARLGARRARASCRQLLGRRAAPSSEAARSIDAYLHSVVRVARFSAFERLFALWHHLHVPLCIVLFGAAAIHVVAVHMY